MGHGDKAVGYAKGGLKGVADLPKQLWGQIFKKQIALKKEANPSREEDDTEENVPARRRGKKGPYKYGIDNYLFYQVCSEEERSVYLASEDVSDVDLREQLYSESRGAIAEAIRSSGSLLTRVVRGFFQSTIHLHRQFLHFTSEGTELLPRIEANWSQQVLHMESYLKKVSNQKNMFAEKLKELDNRVQTFHQGSQLMKQVGVVRLLAECLDKDGRGIFLLPGEDSVTSSPFLKLVEMQNR